MCAAALAEPGMSRRLSAAATAARRVEVTCPACSRTARRARHFWTNVRARSVAASLHRMPDQISFARGAPSIDIVAVEDLKAAAQRAFENDPGGTCAYGTSIGYPPLRSWIAEKHELPPEQVIVTNGSMQADAFLFELLVEDGDLVVVEAPTYDRTLLSLQNRGADILAIPLEKDGIDV